MKSVPISLVLTDARELRNAPRDMSLGMAGVWVRILAEIFVVFVHSAELLAVSILVSFFPHCVTGCTLFL